MPNPRGRQPIAVNQPPSGGSLYPFVNPSNDILYLLGDFFVSFDDIDDEIVYPLRVAWMYGFGTNAVAPPPGWPTPAHSHDLVIVDANDVVVFDSTLAITFTSSTWDNRLEILEWTNSDRICRCTKFTQWTQADINDGQTLTYDDYIEPVNGELQADCWYQLPKRITSVQVGLTNITGKKINFSEGYNVALTQLANRNPLALNLPLIQQTKSVVAGTRQVNQIQIAANVGNGLGAFPGCTSTELTVKTINRVKANSYSNFTLDGEGCIRYQRPVGLISSNPREFDYASFVLSPTESAAAVQFHNNCKNCCDCTYFAQTYQGIKRQWFLYKDVADLAQTTRDVYSSNRDRWLAQKAIRESTLMRVRLSPDGDCKIRWGVSLCNAGKCCISDLKLYVLWMEYVNGVLTTPVKPQFSCTSTYINGSAQCNGPEPIVPVNRGSNGDLQEYYWDYCDPQTITTVYGRHCVPDCRDVPATALKIVVFFAIYWGSQSDDPGTGQPCNYPQFPASMLPADVETTWNNTGTPIPAMFQSVKLSPFTVVSNNNPFCNRCDCE